MDMPSVLKEQNRIELTRCELDDIIRAIVQDPYSVFISHWHILLYSGQALNENARLRQW